jgi:hypothetical protein
MPLDVEVRGVTQPAATGEGRAASLGAPQPRSLRAAQQLAEAAERNVFVILVLALAGAFRVGLLGLGIGSDTWYTLLGGRWVSRSWIPHADTLTVLGHGREWVDQQWLGHLAIYGLWRLGGWPLALVCLLGLFLGAFAIVAAAARRSSASAHYTAVAALFRLVAAMGETGFRAQSLAYPLFAAVLFLLLDDERRPSRRVYWVMPLLVLWANIHGSVVLGAGVVCLRGLTDLVRTRRPTRRSVALIAAPWLCTLASPYGLALPGYYLRLLHNPTLSRFASEWQPATLKSEPVFFVVLLAGVVLTARRMRAETAFAALALAATGVAGLLAVRNVVWFALTAAAVLPGALDASWPMQQGDRRRGLNLALAGSATAVLVVVAAAYASHDRSWFERGYPARAGNAVAAAAAADPGARVFANERYADWLLFEHAELAGRVAYDARFELLSARALTSVANFRLEQGADWMRAADGYDVLVLDPSADRGAVTLLERSPGTRVLYRDRDVVVIRR